MTTKQIVDAALNILNSKMADCSGVMNEQMADWSGVINEQYQAAYEAAYKASLGTVYPKWKYHPLKIACTVQDADEEARLGSGWQDAPCSVPTPQESIAITAGSPVNRQQLKVGDKITIAGANCINPEPRIPSFQDLVTPCDNEPVVHRSLTSDAQR